MHEYISSPFLGSRTHGIRRPHLPPVVTSKMRHPARLVLTGAALLVATACNNDSSVAPLRAAPPTLSGSPALAALATDVLAPVVRYYADARGGDGSSGRSRKWAILSAPAIDAPPVDDANVDASVRTTIDFGAGRISRRIKHFTGYNVLTAEVCIVQPSDPYCVERP